ncbi:MAG: SDR family oxidoreductase [Dehalococcoidia bacterium]|nr:SDR family oxidoreductase [Dehalococcoidia bacterium]
MDLGLKGKVALVTGASWGIGREIAVAFASEGANVVVHYHSHGQEAEDVAREASARGVRAFTYQADINDGGQVQAMVQKTLSEMGRVDILISNAGYSIQQAFVDTTREDWDKTLLPSLYGPLNCCHAVIEPMIAQGWGRIVSVVTDAARVGQSKMALNSAARAAVIALMKSLAREYGRNGITANAVALGWIRTPATAPYLDQWGSEVVKFYPVRRLGVTTDVAPAVTFLASDAASWITGQVLAINGGYSMQG